MSNVPQKYNYYDLKKYCNDEDLLRTLKSQWGYEEDQVFEIIGEASLLKPDVFFNLRSVINGKILQYPQDGIPTDEHLVSFSKKINNLRSESTFFKFEVVLASEKVRKNNKRHNIFALNAIDATIQPLESLPKTFKPASYTIGDNTFIEKWIVETYKKQNSKEINKEINILRKHKEEIEISINAKKEEFREEVEIHKDRLEAIEGAIEIKIEEFEKNDTIYNSRVVQWRKEAEEERKKKEALEKKILEKILFKKDLEKKLEDLHNILQEKADRLLALELIDENFHQELCGISKKDISRQGHSFEEVFKGDENLAIKYIQAFMYKKGIIYKESLLKSFYALLKTHDLIILAGDSGSGKTNLIKSFAEAIGGKAIIVPVKPNWTSAEDLLGYYNPIEQRFLATDFLEALFEAKQHPDTPYFICLDEMNLARVEYYFADFLSLLEDRQNTPEIKLYSKTEASHLGSEVKNFLALIQCTQEKLSGHGIEDWLGLLQNEEINAKLHELCGFRDGDSLLKYHSYLRKILANHFGARSELQLPSNVRIIGAINVDETTHYLSPKILDRAHVIRFGNPLLMNREAIKNEIKEFTEIDMTLPVLLTAQQLGQRIDYPPFDDTNEIVAFLIVLVQEYLEKLGVEFTFRTVRQSQNYSQFLQSLNCSQDIILNNIVLHKVLPKLMFDGAKFVEEGITRENILINMRNFIANNIDTLDDNEVFYNCIEELNRVINNAINNDWNVNYWTR